MTPPALQVPPRAAGLDASVCGWPPPMSSRFNELLAKKPIDRLSGDQNG
jgi:hypothetical protein